MPSYDSTARVPFASGGKVGSKKPRVKRIILWKGKAKDWPGAKEAARQTRNKKAEGGRIEFKRGGGVTGIKKKQSKEHKKKTPIRTFLRNTMEGKYMDPRRGTAEDPKWYLNKNRRTKKAEGGWITKKEKPKDREESESGSSWIKKKKKSWITKKKNPTTWIKKKKRTDDSGEVRPPNKWIQKKKKSWITKKKKAVGKAVGEQGYKDREDESLGMRTGKESDKKASMRDRRDESYGLWRRRPNQRINRAKGGKADKNWIQGVNKSIKKRGTKGVCTGKKFGSASCPPGSKRYNLAKTFKKMARAKHASGGLVRFI
jgi:hypothetical protein